jgi:hypothetical protein
MFGGIIRHLVPDRRVTGDAVQEKTSITLQVNGANVQISGLASPQKFHLPGKTDHLKLAATLAQGATADFMY